VGSAVHDIPCHESTRLKGILMTGNVTVLAVWLLATAESRPPCNVAWPSRSLSFRLDQFLGGSSAAWAGSHTWVIPFRLNQDPAQLDLDMKFLKFLYDNNLSWALTGHFPARSSAQASKEYAAMPHRLEYAGAALIAHYDPEVPEVAAWQTVVHEEVAAVLRGQKTIEQGLTDMQSRMDEFVRMGGG
jgi:maltose-binding protein MalE